MRLLKFTAALTLLIALGAFSAAGAFGAAVTEDVKWYEGEGAGTELVGGSFFFLEMPKKSTFTFATTVAGTNYELQATSIECVGCTIENSGGVAIGGGKLKFMGVTVKKPAGCHVASEIETATLSLSADWMATTNYWKFVPMAGETHEWAKFQITGCASETTMIAKGSVFVEAANATGTQATLDELRSSPAINSAAGGSFKVGVENATLTGTLFASLGEIVFPSAYFGLH